MAEAGWSRGLDAGAFVEEPAEHKGHGEDGEHHADSRQGDRHPQACLTQAGAIVGQPVVPGASGLTVHAEGHAASLTRVTVEKTREVRAGGHREN